MMSFLTGTGMGICWKTDMAPAIIEPTYNQVAFPWKQFHALIDICPWAKSKVPNLGIKEKHNGFTLWKLHSSIDIWHDDLAASETPLTRHQWAEDWRIVSHDQLVVLPPPLKFSPLAGWQPHTVQHPKGLLGLWTQALSRASVPEITRELNSWEEQVLDQETNVEHTH